MSLHHASRVVSAMTWVAPRVTPSAGLALLRSTPTRALLHPRRTLHGAVPMDGNEAAAHVAYGLSDFHAIFPITPASTMGELADAWNSQGKKNAFGEVPGIVEMQSEGGVASASHAASMAGSLVSTFTSSQGLLLMVPNLFRVSGGLLPAVFHVASRKVFGEGGGIYCDHSDVMICRATGICMMASSSPQEAMDLALVSHLAAIKGSVPFLHFFDGFRTSHEINTVVPVSYEDMYKLVDHEAIQRHRDISLNPEHPYVRGVCRRPGHSFQIIEASHPHWMNVIPTVEKCMDDVAQLTGRQYKPFTYVGHPEAERVILLMGSGALTAAETVAHMAREGEKVGAINVHLFRPFSAEHLERVLPPTVRKIAVLDRVREVTAPGDPLFVDVCTALRGRKDTTIIGGRYGIGGKEFNPAMAMAVLDNLKLEQPKTGFVVGINDDLTYRSLSVPAKVDTCPEGTQQCMFWGIGGDGTIGANKEAMKIIIEHTPLHGQGSFEFSSHKSGGLTVSHIRFGKEPIQSPYNIVAADYVAVHTAPYFKKYPQIVDPLKEGGTLVINSSWKTIEEIEAHIPDFVKRKIARKRLHVYNIDATDIALKSGLKGRVNMVMQSVFFQLSGVLPAEEALRLLKDAVKKQYIRKGDEVVRKNQESIDKAVSCIREVAYPAEKWAQLPDDRAQFFARAEEGLPDFIRNVVRPQMRMQDDLVPVSLFDPRGTLPLGVSQYEKRGVASRVAKWKADDCVQCNMCALLCPHAAIRPFVFTEEEAGKAPDGFEGIPALVPNKNNKSRTPYTFRIQVSPYDCTGCELCTQVCPENCLTMEPFEDVARAENSCFQYAEKLPPRDYLFPSNTIRGSQMRKPGLEYSGACPGCGETAIMKLVTQLYGDEMFIANPAGCSCVWGAMFPFGGYAPVNEQGYGPAYMQSLFEDAAEAGLGIYHSSELRRARLQRNVQVALQTRVVKDEELCRLLSSWLVNFDNFEESKTLSREIKKKLDEVKDAGGLLSFMWTNQDMFAKKVTVILGGDGWANDIGYGGLDHTLASGAAVKVLVMDNEVYANTGGQASKATPRGGMAKYAMSGKANAKKDLGAMMMSYGNIYVASICLDADPKHALRAIREAMEFKGPALVMAYAPCIAHGIRTGLSSAIGEAKRAVDSGYVLLYRFNPERAKKGQNPLTIDSPAPDGHLSEFIENEDRFVGLQRIFPDEAKIKQGELGEDVQSRYRRFVALAAMYGEEAKAAMK